MSFQVESTRRVRRVLRTMMALEHFQFFANLVLRMPIKADPKRQTIGADGRNIWINPDWVAKASNDQIREKLCGCVLKCGLKHHTRRDDRDYERWQQASHLTTLPLLEDAGVIDPEQAEGGLRMSVERAYDQIPDMPQMGDGDSGGGEQQDQDSDDAGDDAPPEGPPSFDAGMGEVMDSPARNEQERDASGDGSGDDEQAGAAGSGGAADGDSGGGEQQDQDSDDAGDGQATSDPLQAEEQQWDEWMQQAMQWSKTQGSMPGAIQQRIEAAHFSELDWRDLLRRFLVDRQPNDYDWSRPNRRFVEQGLYLPSLDGRSMDAICFAVDTSGSMSEQELAVIWGEIRGAAEDLQPSEVIVVQCDTAIHAVDRYHASELPEQLDARGRGGTDFRPVFEWLKTEDRPPAVLLFMTDMMGAFPEEEPDCETLWINTHSRATDPPFGERIDFEAAP